MRKIYINFKYFYINTNLEQQLHGFMGKVIYEHLKNLIKVRLVVIPSGKYPESKHGSRIPSSF